MWNRSGAGRVRSPVRVTARVLACLLVPALTGCTQAPQADRPRPERPTASPPTAGATTGTARTTHDNVVTTRRFSAWLLHAVPMPPSAQEWHHSPTVHYRHASMGIGPSDARFTRTTWWTVPLSSGALDDWLRHHAPPGLLRHSDFSGSSESEGVWELDRDFHAASSSSHTEGWVSFAFTSYGDGLVVRVDTFTGARFARTVLVPTDATSVTIRRTERSTVGRAREHATVRKVTGSRAVARLVGLVNSLPGAMTGQFVTSCPPTLTQRNYSMRFATPDGSFVASLPDTSCVPTLGLRHDGVRVGPRLDPRRRFAETLDRYLERAFRPQVTDASAGPARARRRGSRAAR